MFSMFINFKSKVVLTCGIISKMTWSSVRFHSLRFLRPLNENPKWSCVYKCYFITSCRWMQGLPHLYTQDHFGFSFRGLKKRSEWNLTELHVILLIIRKKNEQHEAHQNLLHMWHPSVFFHYPTLSGIFTPMILKSDL
jgi:hypothetical protein